MLKISYLVKRVVLPFVLILCISCSNFTQDSSVDYQKVVNTFNEAWNTGNYDLLDKVVHPDYLKQEGNEQIVGIEALKNYVKNFRETMHDAKITYVEEIYGAEKAAIRFTLEGTPIKTGKKFKAEGIVIFKFKDGKIIGDKSVFDQLTSLKQQGYTISPPEE
ncbi:ester cyclase [bacterium]|nr:ester cyclase [bacterium]